MNRLPVFVSSMILLEKRGLCDKKAFSGYGPHKWSIAKTAEVSRERVKRIFYFRFPEIVFKLNFFDKS